MMKFTENSSKTRISAAAYKPGFGYFGQQWYEIQDEELVILVVKVGHRRDVYRET
jgi:hypothetical protein